MVEVFAVTEFHNCQGDDAQELDGTPVLALYASRQTAEQHADRFGGQVSPLAVRATLADHRAPW